MRRHQIRKMHLTMLAYSTCAFVRESLAIPQKNMKKHFNIKSITLLIKPGDEVLVFFPIPHSALSARFVSLYVVSKKLSETQIMSSILLTVNQNSKHVMLIC